jgi:hypothetical protein
METLKRSFQAALIVAAGAVPITAGAQDRVGITVTAGAIANRDPYPTAHFTEPAYVVSVQRVMKRHFVVEGELAHWSHTDRIERGPHDVFGPEGRIGSVTGTTTLDSGKIWNLGANVLLRSTGAVRVYGGGGASLAWEDSEYSQQSFGCSPGLSCNHFVNARWRGPLPLFRALAGVEVPMTPRVGVYTSVRAESITWEDTTNWFGAVAGVRFSFD